MVTPELVKAFLDASQMASVARQSVENAAPDNSVTPIVTPDWNKVLVKIGGVSSWHTLEATVRVD
jgi:hypothetical protein